MSIRRNLAVAAAATLTATGVGATAGTAAAAPPVESPVGSYIVTLDSSTTPTQGAERAARLGGRIQHVYTAALSGFAVQLPAAAAARLSRLPGVVDVEADQVVQATATQSEAPWGLDRIDQDVLPLNGSYTYTASGATVTAYVIDTGIRSTHNDLRGHVAPGYNAVPGKSTTEDCNGHGTHVAGTIGGRTYGVAKDVTLVPVRVLGCNGSGTTAGVIAGVDWVTADHEARKLKGLSPAVANMSLGGGISDMLDAAVSRSIVSGVTYAVAAGNGNSAGTPQDACGNSPARTRDAITVAATDRTDAVASFSNFGTCVDLFAPGVSITSAWSTNDRSTNTISGTSMATPHVAGVAALQLSMDPTATPAQIAARIIGNATPDIVRNELAGTPDLLLSTY